MRWIHGVDSSEAAPFALIAGGGTGGHVLPAIAIGRALVAAGHPIATIQFVGSSRGMERTIVPDAGFDITLLPGRGIVRRLSVDNIGAIAGLLVGMVKGVRIVAGRRPQVVVSVGGYASFACVVGAALTRTPLVVAEQNATPGLANRLAGRVAAASAVAFAGTPLPRAVLTGNPVRPEVLDVDRSPAGQRAAREALGMPTDGRVVAVSGGSLGARSINLATIGLAERWAGRGDTTIYHVVGERDAAAMAAQRPEARPGGLRYIQVDFEQRMDLVYAAADIMVGRAGASTVTELAAVGLPSVLVPLPGAPGDHQTVNARRLQEAAAAVLVPDSQLDAVRLDTELTERIENPSALAAMGAAALTLARPNAAADVAALAIRHARG